MKRSWITYTPTLVKIENALKDSRFKLVTHSSGNYIAISSSELLDIFILWLNRKYLVVMFIIEAVCCY